MPVDTMKKIIRQLIDLHLRLTQLAIKKTEFVKAGDTQALAQLTKQETPLVDQVNQLEHLRIEETVRTTEGLSERGWTFKRWIEEIIPQEERDEWDALYAQLKSAVSELRRVNQLNQLLLNQSLQFVRLSLNLLQPRPSSTTYGNNGNTRTTSYSGRIDSRA
ncbi:MAG: flagellar protein FlgN [Sporolactobacillus sp.]